MRTIPEVVARLHAMKQDPRVDIFGFESGVLLGYLPLADALPFLDEPKLTPEIRARWDEEVDPLDREVVLGAMTEYMSFAVEKVLDHRGLSAGRSVAKMLGWLWLLGDNDLREQILSDTIPYPQYGAPRLRAIMGKYDLRVDDARGETFVNMSEGRPCRPDCRDGCGVS